MEALIHVMQHARAIDMLRNIVDSGAERLMTWVTP
jgi:hypothetical protein